MKPLVITISIIFILAGMLNIEFSLNFQYVAVFLLMGVLGLSHGSIDHIIASDFLGLIQKNKKHIFILFYILIILLYILLWYIFPLISFILFIAYSAYHFGQADVAFLSKKFKKATKILLGFSYGLMLISAFTFFNEKYAESTYPIWFQEILHFETLYQSALYIFSISTSFFLIFFSALLFTKQMKINVGIFFIVKTILIMLLFYFLPPLLGFSLYFGLWHSLFVLKIEFEEALKIKLVENLKSFIQKLIPFTLVSLVAMLIIIFLGKETAHFTTLIAISVLAFPHTILMHFLYEKKLSKA